MSVSILDAILFLGGSETDFSRIVGNTYEGIEWTEGAKFTENQVKEAVKQLEKVEAETEYQRLRAAAYPDFRDYLDGVVKGDQEQIQAYIEKCLEVKETYPKPTN